MSGGDGAILAAIFVLFLASAVLALAETAFTKMNRIRALALEEEGRRNAARLARLLERPEQTINPLLLLLLACQFVAATLVGVLVGEEGALGFAIGAVAELIVFFVFAEVIPKTYAIQQTERAALQVTPLLWAMTHFPPLRGITRALIGIANVVLPGRGLKEDAGGLRVDDFEMGKRRFANDAHGIDHRVVILHLIHVGVRRGELPRHCGHAGQGQRVDGVLPAIPDETGDSMSPLGQCFHEMSTEEARRSREENPHACTPT